jgi:hypothetical protein
MGVFRWFGLKERMRKGGEIRNNDKYRNRRPQEKMYSYMHEYLGWTLDWLAEDADGLNCIAPGSSKSS